MRLLERGGYWNGEATGTQIAGKKKGGVGVVAHLLSTRSVKAIEFCQKLVHHSFGNAGVAAISENGRAWPKDFVLGREGGGGRGGGREDKEDQRIAHLS